MSKNIGISLLMSKLENYASSKGIKKIDIARKVNLTKGSISQSFSGKVTMNFLNFVKIVSMLVMDHQDRINFISEFVRVNDRPENNRLAMEWCSQKGQMNIQEYLVKEEKKKDPNNGLPYVYDCLSKRNNNKLVQEALYTKVIEYKCKKKFQDVDAILLGEMATVYAFLDMNGHNIIFKLLDPLEKQIDSIPPKKKYLKDCYNLRLMEIKAISYMRNDQISEATRIIDEIMFNYNEEDFPVVFTSIFSLLAEMNLFSNYEQSMYYIRKAINLFETSNIVGFTKRKKELKDTHDFIKVFNKDFEGLYLESLPEKAFYYSSLGNEKDKKKALLIYDELERSNGYLTPFQKYFKGLTITDSFMVNEAIEELRRKGNLFYANGLLQETLLL